MFQNKLIRGITVGLISFLLTMVMYFTSILTELEWKSWDLRMRFLSGSSSKVSDIVCIYIDQESLDIYEKELGLTWPWPRQIYQAITDFSMAGGARAIFFDLIFSESSSWGVEDDRMFARAMERSGRVFLPVFLSRKKKIEDKGIFDRLQRFSINYSLPSSFIVPAQSATLPVPELLEAAVGVGNVNLSPDKDGIFRRIPLLFSFDSLKLPALPLAVANFVTGKNEMEKVALDKQGRMILRFYGPTGTFPSFSAAVVINSFVQFEQGISSQINPEEFKGKIVYVGTSAPGLMDWGSTPFSSICPGVEIQATALANLLNDDYFHVIPRGAFIFISLVAALLAGLAISFMEKSWQIASAFSLLLIFVFVLSSALFLFGWWLETVPVFLAVSLSFIGASLLNYTFEGKRRRMIKSVFRYYLSSDVIDKLLSRPELLKLGGEARQITSFFSDLAGFTSISENLEAQVLVRFLNQYLSEMTDIILSLGGTLDKYEGDAIIAFWNAPLDQPDHALRGCRAALAGQKRLQELNEHFFSLYGYNLSMRIGLNSGEAVVGNMGSSKRFDYTAMGDTVNLASRLEGACKFFGVPILMGEKTAEMVEDTILLREIASLRVLGKKKPVKVFQPVGEKDEVEEAVVKKVEMFHQGVKLYRERKWQKAEAVFNNLPGEPVVEIYLKNIKDFKEIPPSEDWQGVFELNKK